MTTQTWCVAHGRYQNWFKWMGAGAGALDQVEPKLCTASAA
jgi:hypothetical protein